MSDLSSLMRSWPWSKGPLKCGRGPNVLTFAPDSSNWTILGEFRWSFGCCSRTCNQSMSDLHLCSAEVEDGWKFSHVHQVLQIVPFWKSPADLVVLQVPTTNWWVIFHLSGKKKRGSLKGLLFEWKYSHLLQVRHVGPLWKRSGDLVGMHITVKNQWEIERTESNHIWTKFFKLGHFGRVPLMLLLSKILCNQWAMSHLCDSLMTPWRSERTHICASLVKWGHSGRVPLMNLLLFKFL
jgi:hypothetical protein